MAPRMLVVATLVGLVVGLGGFAQALVQSAVVPDADLLGRMALAAIGAAVGLAVPVGALAGVTAGLRDLRDGGAWLGLRAAGYGGRAVAMRVMGPVGVAIVLSLGASHFAEPAARAAMRDARIAAAARVRPVEGRTLTVGPWAVATEGGRLHFAGAGGIGWADAWSIARAESGVLVELGAGAVRSVDGRTRATFGSLEMPIPMAAGGKPQASERTTPDLMRQIAISASLGRDAYERWILWKRTLLPICLAPLALAAVPLGLGRRPVPLVVGAQVVALWGVVRVADQAIATLRPTGAATLLVAAAMVWPVAAWWRWREA